MRILQRVVRVTVAAVLCAVCGPSTASAQDPQRQVVVVEPSGGAIAGARLVLRSTQGTVLQQGATGDHGPSLSRTCRRALLAGSRRARFPGRHVTLEVSARESRPIEIVLSLAGFQSEVTVTTERGMAADVERTPPVVTVREADDFRTRPIATLGNALEGAAGVMVQQSTYGQVSPFLRGLTGYHVLNLIDGIRFNNSTFRSGPNQYLAFVDSDQAQRIEAMLGPASSQFGSDALGGAIQVVTPAPRFASSVERFKVNGDGQPASARPPMNRQEPTPARSWPGRASPERRRIVAPPERPPRRPGARLPPCSPAPVRPLGPADSGRHRQPPEGHRVHAIRVSYEGDRAAWHINRT